MHEPPWKMVVKRKRPHSAYGEPSPIHQVQQPRWDQKAQSEFQCWYNEPRSAYRECSSIHQLQQPRWDQKAQNVLHLLHVALRPAPIKAVYSLAISFFLIHPLFIELSRPTSQACQFQQPKDSFSREKNPENNKHESKCQINKTIQEVFLRQIRNTNTQIKVPSKSMCTPQNPYFVNRYLLYTLFFYSP